MFFLDEPESTTNPSISPPHRTENEIDGRPPHQFLTFESALKCLLNCCAVNEDKILKELRELTMPADMATRKVVYSVLQEFLATHPSTVIRAVRGESNLLHL